MKNRKNKKIIILILSSDRYPSPRNEKVQFETWVQRASNFNAEVFYYKGGEEFSKNKNYITFPVGDEIKDIGYKTLEAFEWVDKNFDYDYLLRANSSCYVNLEELTNFFDSKDNQEPIYGGHMNNYNDEFDYVQGVGIFLNRKAIQKILKNKFDWDHSKIDDVALGKIAHQENFNKYPVDSLHVDGKLLKGILNKKYIIYRCKMENFGYPRYLDKYFLKIIENIFNGELNLSLLKIKKIIFNFIKLFNLKYYKLKYSSLIYYKIVSLIPNRLKKVLKS
mgnify:CR=1 FL=1